MHQLQFLLSYLRKTIQVIILGHKQVVLTNNSEMVYCSSYTSQLSQTNRATLCIMVNVL